MLPMISRRSVLTLDSLAAQARQAGSSGQDNGGLTCFSSFVAGSGSLHTSLQRTRALPFRYVPAKHTQAIHPSYVHQLLIRQHFSFSNVFALQIQGMHLQEAGGVLAASSRLFFSWICGNK